MSPDNTNPDKSTEPDKLVVVDLIGLDQWTSVRTDYTYAGTPGVPQLIVNFELRSDRYQPLIASEESESDSPEEKIPKWQENAVADQKRFEEIYIQLNQLCGEPGTLKPSVYAVSIFLVDALLKSSKIPLGEKDAQSLRDFIFACFVYVTNRAAGQDAGIEPICRLEIPLPLAQISDSDVIELSLALRLERQSAADPATAVPESAETKIPLAIEITPPDSERAGSETDFSDDASSARNIVTFARRFESLFCNEDWQLRIGASAPAPYDAARPEATSIVRAIRLGKKPDNGFYYELNGGASFYAPKPIAKSLISAADFIDEQTAGADFPANVEQSILTGVDLNQWSNSALSAIDDFSAEFAAQAQILDRILFEKPETDGYAAKILKHKATLARAIARTVIPILETNSDDEISRRAAQEEFRRALLDKLSRAFATTAITVFDVTKVSTDSPVRFCGRLHEPAKSETAKETASQNYSLTPAAIEYYRTADEKGGGWRLPTLFFSENDRKKNAVSLSLVYALTHLELDPKGEAGADNIDVDSPIRFVTAPHLTQIGDAAISFPIVQRTLPVPLTLIFQNDAHVFILEKEQNSALSPAKMAFGNLSLAYAYDYGARDSVSAKMTFSPPGKAAVLTNKLHPLFVPLARFTTAYNQIQADFDAYLRKITASSEANDAETIAARSALERFENITGAFAAAYEAWSNSAEAVRHGEIAPKTTCSFDIVLKRGAGGNARIDVINAQISGTMTVLPVVELESCSAVRAADKPADALVSYNYVVAPENYLSYEQALAVSKRTITLNEINVFAIESVAGNLKVTRNDQPVSGQDAKISEEFEFSTAEAGFAAPVVSELRYSDFDLSALKITAQTLKNYLDAFFGELFQGVTEVSVRLRITALFSYQSPDSDAAPRIVLPIALFPLIPVELKERSPLPFAASLAGEIQRWTENNRPEINASSQYSFDLEIFAGEPGKQKLLLSVKNLFIEAHKIQALINNQ